MCGSLVCCRRAKTEQFRKNLSAAVFYNASWLVFMLATFPFRLYRNLD